MKCFFLCHIRKRGDKMNENLIKEALYQKYIEPTKKKRESYIGIEIEMPILNLDKKPVDFAIIHKITD